MGRKIINNLRLYNSPEEKVSLVFEDKILFTGSEQDAVSFAKCGSKAEIYDGGGKTVVPGFIDIHNHGGGGYDFACCDEKGMEEALLSHLRKGTTTVLPTAASADNSMLLKMFDVYRNVQKGKYGSCLGGIHLEGPFLNPSKKGAMPPDMLRLPSKENYEPLLDAGADIIKRFTIAPELPGAFELGEKLASLGIIVSAGHSEALPETVRDAKNHGFSLGTHLFNAMTSMHKEGIFRKPGVAESILSDDGYNIEVISDCIHVPPEILRMCMLVKGPDKMCLISDAISAAGLGIKEGEKYAFVENYILVEDGVAKLPDRSAVAGSLACGVSMLKAALRAGIPFKDAVKMLSETPASFCGFEDRGKILPGYLADFVILTEENDVYKVFKSGEEVK